jgi:hypothetical protein
VSDRKYLRTSDGTGNAVLAHVTVNRITGSMTLEVDSLSKWPPFFIATTGTQLSTGYINTATVTEFLGHTTAGKITIDSFAPGSTDVGNTIDQIVVLKQTTGWANELMNNLDVQHVGDGTHKTVTTDTLATTSDLTIGGALKMGANTVSTGGSIFTLPQVNTIVTGAGGSITPTIASSVYIITTLDSAGTINAPTGGTPREGQGLLLRIKDNGTARALSWNAIYRAFGSALPTTTILGKTMYIPMRYNSVDTKWDVFTPTTEV